MGTSSSASGPKSTSPLVPEWADSDPGKPLPPPEGQRFRGFRTEFGRAIGGGGGSFRAALGRYAREATGGASVGPRRFGPAYAAGASLADLLNDLRSGGTGEASVGVDLSGLIGRSLDYVAQEVARVLAPDNADADQINAAIQEAIAEALPSAEPFDPKGISMDSVVALLVEFFSRILFQEIAASAGDAWNKSPRPELTTQSEADLLEMVKASVDKHLSPVLASGLGKVTRAELAVLERRAVEEVWREWETYE